MRMLEVGRTEVPPEIAEWLQVERGSSVVVRRRLQLVNDHPAVLSASYFPLWLAEGTRLGSSDALLEGPDELIEGLGHRFVRGVEVFRARMPAPEEARILRLDPGIPVVRMLHVDYDAQGRTLQVADDLYAGDQHEFAFEWSEAETGDGGAQRAEPRA